ncbi:hypothetical protein BVRB_2g040700 [Beta vulgaris subsp. vulgaris]|nr:hypothetical protein BVRB_2g040700 [Beta vulgaris subsp. vulgaris]
MEQSQSTSNFVVWHRKQGPLIKAPMDQYSSNPIDISLIVVGKFIDNREFSVRHIQSWVDSWITRGRIKVTKEGKLFFFHCRDMQDRFDILGLYDTMNFRGALLILKPWKPLDSFKSFNFSESAVWVRLEGIPLIFHSKSIANELFSRIGKVLIFDENSERPGIKKFFRALIWIKIKSPLVPGMYIEVQENRTLWVDFRYEGVFVFCKRCGKIGHKSSSCLQSWEKAKEDIEATILKACNPEAPMMYGNPNASLYSNRIIGLPHTPEFLTTVVKLNEPRKPPDPSSSSSSSSNDDDDDDQNQPRDEEMPNASHSQESHSNRINREPSPQSGPSKRPREGDLHGTFFERGGPSTLAADGPSPRCPTLCSRFRKKRKGKNVLSLSKTTYMKPKRNHIWLDNAGRETRCASAMSGDQAAASGTHYDNFASFTHFNESNENPTHFHQLISTTGLNSSKPDPPMPLLQASINTQPFSLSSFTSFSNTFHPRDTQVPNMESNVSSPLSSNSFTQPSNLPLSPPNQQCVDSIPPILAPSTTLEGYFEDFNHNRANDFIINDALQATWENILETGSMSSFFNPYDALAMGDPPFNSFPLNDQLDWSEFQNWFPEDISTLSPQTPLQLPGSHSSLQTGSSSSFHSTFPGVPATEFADLRIFPAWSQVTNTMDQHGVELSVLGKRKIDDLNAVVCEGWQNSEVEEEAFNKSVESEVKKKRVLGSAEVQEGADGLKIMDQAPHTLAQPKIGMTDGKLDPSPLTGQFIKAKLPFQYEEAREAALSEDGPRKLAARPPRPKQSDSTYLVSNCSKKEVPYQNGSLVL